MDLTEFQSYSSKYEILFILLELTKNVLFSSVKISDLGVDVVGVNNFYYFICMIRRVDCTFNPNIVTDLFKKKIPFKDFIIFFENYNIFKKYFLFEKI